MIKVFKQVIRASRSFKHSLHKKRIMFHHIPKCGGSAITQPFRMRSLASFHKVHEDATLTTVDPLQELPFFQRHDAAFEFKANLCRYMGAQETALIQSHVPWFPAEPSTPLANYDRITLLREPLSRFLSHYFWDKDRDNHNGIHLELEPFLETDQALGFGSLMTRFLSGTPWPLATTEAAVQTAVENAAFFSTIGFLEDLPQFGADIQTKYGWKMKFPVSNTGSGANYAKILDGPLGPRIREVCAPDIALYSTLYMAR